MVKMSDARPTISSDRSTTVGLHKGAKSLLRNVIRHTDTHNRMLEESEMWQLYHRMKRAPSNDKDEANIDKKKTDKVKRAGDGRKYSSEDRVKDFREPDIHQSFLYDDRKNMRWEGVSRRAMKRAHMDDSSDEDRQNISALSKSTFWMRQLHKAEEGDPDRWGHTGFKELYPDAFDSDRSAGSGDNDRHTPKKKKHSKKRHKHKSLDKKKKRKRDDSDSVKKKKKKKKDKRSESSKGKRRRSKREKSSDESDNNSSTDNSTVNKKKVEMRNNEMSETDKDSDNETERKRARRNMKTESEREKKGDQKTTVDKPHWSKKRRKD
uniref:Uncharacterized protein n=1 Tax=Arion vulgaris TaxID=1028688 RepID=A0A0B6ZDC4_9EUPU